MGQPKLQQAVTRIADRTARQNEFLEGVGTPFWENRCS